jgi:phosphate transport system substrate-binding protein
VLAGIALACGGPGRDRTAGERIDLTGAGATFPYPLYRQWFADYAGETGVRINYLSVGSAEGLRLLGAGDVDFGATERPLAALEASDPGCGPVAVPMVAGAIAVTYHVPGLTIPLVFDADVLADIFAGRVTQWNAQAIRALNAEAKLPALPITVVHRAGGSGTSRAFDAFLRTSKRWRVRAAGDTGDVRWPAGIAVEGNEGVAGEVRQTPGTIGYVELAYARLNHLPVATLRNAAARLVAPSEEGVRAVMNLVFGAHAAPGAPLPVAASEPDAYPVATLTWLVIDPRRADASKRRTLVAFVRWALHDGAAQARALEYSPLPPRVVAYYDSVLRDVPDRRCPAAGEGRPR